MKIYPEPGVVLVQLAVSKYGDIPVVDKPHNSVTFGTVVQVNETDKDKQYLKGRTAYWREYKDDARVDDAERLCLIEIKDILGTSED